MGRVLQRHSRPMSGRYARRAAARGRLAALSAMDTSAVEHAARTAWRILGCRDVARIDFRLRGGVPYFLEVNPLPGLHPQDSDLVIMAKLVDWSYPQLVGSILQAGLRRNN